MSLIMTFMLEPAKLQMNWASARGANTLRSPLDGGRTVTLSVIAHRGAAFQHGLDAAEAVVELIVDLVGRATHPPLDQS
jgi:hypothetical protein